MEAYRVLASGSTGNCEIAFGSIVIDIGVPFSTIKPYLYDIQIIFLSHAHKDHLNISTLKRIAFERPGIRIGCGKWMLPYLEGFKNVDVLEYGKWYSYGDFRVAIGKCYHDIENCFFRIEKNGEKIFRATDTFTLEGVEAKGYSIYALEHNYCEDTVFDIIREKELRGEFSHQRGAINSHLSEQSAMDFYYANKGEHSQLIRLHMSQSYI